MEYLLELLIVKYKRKLSELELLTQILGTRHEASVSAAMHTVKMFIADAEELLKMQKMTGG